MPMYDKRCNVCGRTQIDVWEPIYAQLVPCEITGNPADRCQGAMLRVWLTGPPAVIQDSIEGGIEIKHGLCNPDGSPKKYYSKSEIAKEAKRRGLTNHVEHVTSPGTDKNKYTTRWI